MATLRRITIFVDDPDEGRSEDFHWVEAWLNRWRDVARVADYSTGGWEHLWDIEAPDDVIAEVPERLLCGSKWANPELFGT